MAKEDIYSSKHNPDLIGRTLSKRLEIETVLNSFRTQLMMIVKTEDQRALDDLYIRVMNASVGFEKNVLLPKQPYDPRSLWHDEDAKVQTTADAQMAVIAQRSVVEGPMEDEMEDGEGSEDGEDGVAVQTDDSEAHHGHEDDMRQTKLRRVDSQVMDGKRDK